MQSTSAIVGEVEKSEIVDEDETALMQDISDTFNVHVSKPAKKLVAKPTRHSKFFAHQFGCYSLKHCVECQRETREI